MEFFNIMKRFENNYDYLVKNIKIMNQKFVILAPEEDVLIIRK